MAVERAGVATRSITIAVAGNPNCGKTTIFNNFTGLRQHIANYPGVTVETKAGEFMHGSTLVRVIDLPGSYSLTTYSEEEIETRNFFLRHRPDVVIDVVDATNIERNLFLTTHLLELNIPIVIALNMADEARQRGIEFDIPTLESLLGTQVVPTVGSRKEGMKELLEAALIAPDKWKNRRDIRVNYGQDIETELETLETLLDERPDMTARAEKRWVAVKLIESDPQIVSQASAGKLIETAVEARGRIETLFADSIETVMADRRYGFISGACREAVRETATNRHTFSDTLDEIMTHNTFGLPILLGLMYLLFYLTFTVGAPGVSFLEWFFGKMGSLVSSFWPKGSESMLKSLFVDGVIGGVGGVIVFVPNIMLLFFGLAILEDSGYMARAAFIMDRLMHKIGLHGKSFIPMMIGFGCNIPAIMATRMLDNRRDRLTTMLILPLISCGARLPIYALFIPAFFPQVWQAPVLWSMYIIGILMAVVLARILRKTILRGPSVPFVMELPPYRIPTLRSVSLHMWENGWAYLRKAGTVILSFSVILWALTVWPTKPAYDKDYDAIADRVHGSYKQSVESLATKLGIPGNQFDRFETALKERAESENHETGITFDPSSHAEEFLLMLGGISQARSEENGNESILRVQNPEIYATAVDYLDNVEHKYQAALQEISSDKLNEDVSYSLVGRLGHQLVKVLSPLGFDWKVSTALIGAFAAKEVFVAQMGIVYSVQDADKSPDSLRKHLKRNYSTLQAFCIMIFCLIASPCIATFAITRKESGSWKWAALQWGGLTLIAYFLTMGIYQVGTFLGLGT